MIDLHTHSTASDGTLAPAALVDLAARTGLQGLALTDHDTLAGIAEAQAQAQIRGLRFLAGIELSTGCGPISDLHLLGYGMDVHDAPLLEACRGLVQGRAARADRIVANLNQAGVPLRLEAVLREAGGAAIGRPHVARALVAGGWASSVKDAFTRWLVPGAPGYLPKQRLDTVAAIDLVLRAGGLPVLAHPQTLKLDGTALEALVRDLSDQGLAGIEAYWAKHEPATVERCRDLADRFGLLTTGGSDFHGANKPDITLGMAAGGCRLGEDMMDSLEARLPRRIPAGPRLPA